MKLFLFSFLIFLAACGHSDWRTADRGSAGIAPDPQFEKQAVVQVYAARAFAWRGYFGVHSWIATKEAGASEYITYEVMGWGLRQTGSCVVVSEGIPDRKWFGAEPILIQSLIGAKAAAAIPQIVAASKSYKHSNIYRIWPGPNSNTYISHLIRNTKELTVELPPNAVGKDWIDDGDFFGRSESKTGVQVSVYGALGITVGLAEGIEINVLGLTFGIDFLRPALKLPFIGRLGFSDSPVFD